MVSTSSEALDILNLGIKVSRLSGTLELLDVHGSGDLSHGLVGAGGELAEVAGSSAEEPRHGTGGGTGPGEEHPAQGAGDRELRRDVIILTRERGETYPRADLAQVTAVNLLGPGDVGEVQVEVLVLAGEDLVTQTLLASHVTQLEGGLDPVKVCELGSLLRRGLQDGVDDVVRVHQSPSQGLGGDPAVSLGHTHGTEVTGRED